MSQRAGALVPITADEDDDRLFGVVGLQDDEHVRVAVFLMIVLVEQLERALDVGGAESGEVGRCAGTGLGDGAAGRCELSGEDAADLVDLFAGAERDAEKLRYLQGRERALEAAPR